MTMTEPAGLAEMKARTRATQAVGDFAAVSRQLRPAGENLMQRVGIGTGERVLDVACCTGNAAIRAAQAGGRVTGVGLTPELSGAAWREAAAAGVTIEWVEGDAEALPFNDASFDVVLSTFGVMFAPRHRITAAELTRVPRPGGRLGLCTWIPDGATADLFRALSSSAPPPPFAEPPLLWGSEDHVRDVFSDTGMRLEFERATVRGGPSGSCRGAFGVTARNVGPTVMLRPPLDQRGEWNALRDHLAAIPTGTSPPSA